jgi:hypothetical protein
MVEEKNRMKAKVEQKMNQRQIKVKQQQNKLNNNNKTIHDITDT